MDFTKKIENEFGEHNLTDFCKFVSTQINDLLA